MTSRWIASRSFAARHFAARNFVLTLFALGAGYCANVQPLAAQSVKAVTVTITAPTIALGSRTTATARVRLANGTYATNKPIAWGTSKPGVALVSATGIVSTLTVGSASIVATVNGVVGQATLTVTPTTTPPPPPAPIVASITLTVASRSLVIGQTTQATATARDSAGDLVAGKVIAWTSLAPSIASVTSAGTITAVAAGSATIRATSDAQHADATITVSAPVTPPDTTTSSTVILPTLLTLTKPSVVRTITVASVPAMQAAIDSSKAGDKIQLTCGVRVTGNVVIRGTTGRQLTSTCVLSPGVRVDSTNHLSAIISPSALPAISAAPGTRGWYIAGLEATADPTLPSVNSIVELGDGSATSSAQSPRAITLTQMYIHGTAGQRVHRCVQLNSDSTVITNNYISECHDWNDSQAIWGWNGAGPYTITNNYLEAATEDIGFGGADPAILNLVPSDITIVGNHITKQLAWKGGPWLEKNLVELKVGRRVLIEGNVLENAWPQAQLGWAFVLWSVNQNGGCTWCVTEHVTIRNNWIRTVSAGFQMSEKYGDTPSPAMNHVAISNNLVTGLTDPSVGDGGYGFLMQGAIPSLTISHNTLLNPASPSWTWGAGAGPFSDHVVTDNLTGGCTPNQYQLSMPTGPFSAITRGTSTFTKNVIACFDNYLGLVPSGNLYPTSLAAIGFSSDSATLTSGSPYHHAATDGTDIGANIAAVMAATAGVVQNGSGSRIRRP